MKVLQIDLDKIEHSENSRVVYKESDLSELMGSMKQDGLLQPVGVRAISKGKYDAIFGNRRIMAARKLGWATIAASVVDVDSDKDRDIINLVENLKRQNTSVSEDGRMFAKLLEYGLTKAEVGARLGISIQRIETALDVFNHFPAEFKQLIVNSGTGQRKRAGTVSASMAFHINTVRRSQKLNRPQTRKLLQYAKQDGVSSRQVSAIAPLLRAGMQLQKALGVVDKMEVITISLMVDSAHAESLERKRKKSMHDIIYEILEGDKSLKVTKAMTSGIQNKRDMRPTKRAS